jgi:hypothetical protein
MNAAMMRWRARPAQAELGVRESWQLQVSSAALGQIIWRGQKMMCTIGRAISSVSEKNR